MDLSVDVVTPLVAAGLSPGEAARKRHLFEAALSALPPAPPAGPSAPLPRYFVPGRAEVLGKHTDYAGGRSLVCAVERGFCFVAGPKGPSLGIRSAATGDRAEFPLDPELPLPEAHWSRYPAVVARRLARDFGIERGIELGFASDLPPAAGLSSGTALTIGVFLALAEANRLVEHPLFQAHLSDPVAQAEYLGCVENGRPFGPFEAGTGAGIQGGCEDQAAILLGTAGELAQFRFVPVRLERRVPFPDSHCLVVASSGVVAEKSGRARDAYNALAAAVTDIERRWLAAGGPARASLGAILASSPDALERLRRVLASAPRLLRRLEQFAAESETIVPAAAAALERADLEEFGRLVDRSQAGAESGLGNQIPETIHLQRSARRLGAAAASAFGAGFGGSAWALVERRRAEQFQADWEAHYHEAFPARRSRSEFFATRSGPAALRIDPTRS